MITYEDYMNRHPQVARSRAEKMLSEGNCLFMKENGHDLALLPGNNSSQVELVVVDVNRMTCQCNVFRTKKACPHVAAALGFVERNGGEIPYTNPVTHVYDRLEWLKTKKHDQFSSSYVSIFLRDVKPFLDKLPQKEKTGFLLKLGVYLQAPDSNLNMHAFTECYDYLWAPGFKPGALLFRNRKDCLNAVVALMSKSYQCPFSKKEQEIILKEIAGDDTLTEKYLPDLEGGWAEAFSREQLLRYYKTLKDGEVIPYRMTQLLNRLVEEDPPLFDEFLTLFNKSFNFERFDLKPQVVRKLVEAGYGERLGKVADNLVRRMRGIEDYFNVIQILSHDQFLAAWKTRDQGRFRFGGWSREPDDWEIEVEFREDPEADPEDYTLENLSCRVLRVILEKRPEYSKQVNNAVRKIYRRAVKDRNQDQTMQALMLLTRGEDPIAVKYASEMVNNRKNGEDLVYITAVGMKFDCLQKLVPELKKLEVSHASGQN